MAKEKRSAADLDAELAALEAELAALESKPKKKAAKPEPAPRSVAGATPEPAVASTPGAAPAKEEKRSRFAMPKLGKKKDEAEPAPDASAAPAPAPSPAAEPVPLPQAMSEPAPAPPTSRHAHDAYDLSLWRQEGDAWVRVVRETPVPVVRRVLDEHGSLVREEPASMRDVEDASGVKAERGLGRLLRRK